MILSEDETEPSIDDSECEISVRAKTKQLTITLIMKTSRNKITKANIPSTHENP